MSKLNIISETKDLNLIDLKSGTMSSREIAELTGKLHTHIMRDIRNMLNNLGDQTSFGLVEYTDSKGEKRPMYELNKDYTLCLITRYSDILRMKIIRRWQELEGDPLRAMFEKITLTKKIVTANGSVWGKAGIHQKKNKAIVKAYEDMIINQLHQELDLFLTLK